MEPSTDEIKSFFEDSSTQAVLDYLLKELIERESKLLNECTVSEQILRHMGKKEALLEFKIKALKVCDTRLKAKEKTRTVGEIQ